MKISEVTGRGMRGIGEDSLGSRPVDNGLSSPGEEPGAIRIGGKVVRRYDPRLLPDVLPLSSKRIRVNDRDAMLWKGMDVDGRTHVVWSYDTSSMSEDQDAYLQDPLDPEGDTDGPGKTGDQDDLGEGDVVRFKRLDIGSNTPNLSMAKEMARDLFWLQAGSHYTAEEEAAEQELVDRLSKIGYSAEWDLDEPDFTMVLTHLPSGRQLRMGEDELIAEQLSVLHEIMDMGQLNRMADSAARQIPGAAGTVSRIKAAARALARIGAPVAILGTMLTGITTADAVDRPKELMRTNAEIMQFLQAYETAGTEEERCRLANEWYGVKPPHDVCDISQHRMTTPDASKCQDVYVTRGANKGKTIRQCSEPEIRFPANESAHVRYNRLPMVDTVARDRVKSSGKRSDTNVWRIRA